jgi:hypothetical protein
VEKFVAGFRSRVREFFQVPPLAIVSDFPAAGSPWSQSAARVVFLEVFCHP